MASSWLFTFIHRGDLVAAQSFVLSTHRVGARVTFTSSLLNFPSIAGQFSARFDLSMSRKRRQIYVLLINQSHCNVVVVASSLVGSWKKEACSILWVFHWPEDLFPLPIRFVRINFTLECLWRVCFRLKSKSPAKITSVKTVFRY